MRLAALAVICTLALISWVLMELSHLKIWTQWFEEFQPHYSSYSDLKEEDNEIIIQRLNVLVLVKTVFSA